MSYTKEKNENTAPLNSCFFEDCGKLMFAEKSEVSGRDKFKIVGYSGEVLQHYYWGAVAFDLTGIKFAKKRTPVLAEHQTNNRIGIATKQEITDSVNFEGEFLNNLTAKEIKEDLRDGFPMEASLYIQPQVVETIKEGETVKVNGQILEGPGTVFRKSTVKEVSMCVFGVDSNTSSQILAEGKNITFEIMKGEKMDMTIEKFAEKYPNLYQELYDKGKADGEKAERDLFNEVENVCGGDTELLIQCYKEGKTSEEALKMRAEKLEEANANLQTKLTEAEAKKEQTTVEKETVDPATVEFKDDAGKKEAATEENTEEAWREKFRSDPKVREEFISEDGYVAYQKRNQK